MVQTGADSDLHKAARAKRKPVTVGDMRRPRSASGVQTKALLAGLRFGYSEPMTRINTTEIWERHGYRVERIEQVMGAPQRNIYGPDGVLLIEDAEYTQETEALRDLGFIE